VTSPIQIVPTGLANTAAVIAAFARLGFACELSGDAARLTAADRVVLPGVGAFGAACRRLDQLGVRDALCERIAAGRPTLLICLGMQLLCRDSEESPGASGLGVIPATVRAFPPTVRRPQLGWNHVEPSDDRIPAGHAYFANTYRLHELPAGWSGATTDYGGRFVSALQRDGVLACQFHPEISGDYGASLLQRWLTAAPQAAAVR
jgi:imidazole glycerol-phosphate synthase subunit HisH